jgi:hypothetical protein
MAGAGALTGNVPDGKSVYLLSKFDLSQFVINGTGPRLIFS